eukprot:5592781-Amphidinium_carterae.1
MAPNDTDPATRACRDRPSQRKVFERQHSQRICPIPAGTLDARSTQREQPHFREAANLELL